MTVRAEIREKTTVAALVRETPFDVLLDLWFARFGGSKVILDTLRYDEDFFWFEAARRLMAGGYASRVVVSSWHVIEVTRWQHAGT